MLEIKRLLLNKQLDLLVIHQFCNSRQNPGSFLTPPPLTPRLQVPFDNPVASKTHVGTAHNLLTKILIALFIITFSPEYRFNSACNGRSPAFLR